MKERRIEERRLIKDRRRGVGRRLRHEMGCFREDVCRREGVSDRRNDERRILQRRTLMKDL